MTGPVFQLLAAIAAIQAAPASSTPAPAAAGALQIRYHGILVRVPDLDRAVRFYAGVLGFNATRLSPTLVRLDDRTPIYLERTSARLTPPAGDEARAAVAFQTHDIAAAVTRLRARGVTFLAAAPAPVGVGLSIRFRDPFGNIHALLQQTVAPSAPFDEPEVYNSGFKHPDADTAALRTLFAALGFLIRTERYYPPSLPVGHRDGSFAFMLHENEPWEAEIRPRANPETAAVSLIFATGNLDAARRVLSDRLPASRVGTERSFVLGTRIRAIAPSNVPLELWSLAAG